MKSPHEIKTIMLLPWVHMQTLCAYGCGLNCSLMKTDHLRTGLARFDTLLGGFCPVGIGDTSPPVSISAVSGNAWNFISM
jgi:hypothetical protein